MTRVCKHCGGEITDLHVHPRATACPACRRNSYRRNAGVSFERMVAHDIPIVRAYVVQQGWPTFLKASKALDEHPELMQQIHPKAGRAHILNRFSKAAKALEGPQGQRYEPWAGQSRTLVLTPQEATA